MKSKVRATFIGGPLNRHSMYSVPETNEGGVYLVPIGHTTDSGKYVSLDHRYRPYGEPVMVGKYGIEVRDYAVQFFLYEGVADD